MYQRKQSFIDKYESYTIQEKYVYVKRKNWKKMFATNFGKATNKFVALPNRYMFR